MGAGCCPSDGAHDKSANIDAAPQHGHDHDHSAHDHGHDHGHDENKEHVHCEGEEDCGEKGDACEDEACCDSDDSCDSGDSGSLTCCDSNDERCDEKCIIAVAAMECEKACEGTGKEGDATHSHDHEHDGNGKHPDTACSTHLSRAFDQYSAYLEQARCICRGILDRGWTKSCCESKPAPAKKAHAHAHATGSIHAKTATHHHHQVRRRGKKTAESHSHGSGQEKDDCCTTTQIDFAMPTFANAKDRDLEKAAGLEHLALQVEGMTCSGCGNKMEKTLKGIPGVSGVRVNFVMGSAECSFDSRATTADQIVKASERGTGFKCTPLASDDQNIEVLASGNAAKALTDLPVEGITQAVIVDKKTVRLSYDPTIIGARTLLKRLGNQTGGLAPPKADASVSSGRRHLYDQLIKTCAAAVLTIPVLVLAWGKTDVAEETKAIISLVLATFVQMIAIPDFYRPAISALVHSGAVEMDMLVVISITAAYVYSVVAFGFRMAGKPLEQSEFFETSTLLITLVILGRLIAAFARVRAVSTVSLRSLQTATATIVEDGKDQEVDARLLQYGDLFKVEPHSTIPTDGTVVSGSSEVDESMLTGESVPVFKKDGDAVIAGTINGSGALTARLTRLPGKNTVTDIAQLVEEAANSKPRLQDVADRVASWFVPVVTTVAVIVIVVWLAVGFKVLNYGTGKSISNAITYAVATLAVSCPCALGLAVPMVLVVAGGVAARSGVIIKSAECTERSRKVTDIVFDKTGTITEGDLDVADEEYFLSSEDDAKAITKALVAGNKHPVSLAVAKHVQDTASTTVIEDLHVIPGAGVEASVFGTKLRAGHPKWTMTESHPAVQRMLSQGMTLLAITRDTRLIAVYGLRTRLRAEANKVMAQLTRRKINLHIVSGDQTRAVESVAQQVGIPNIAAQCTPAEKRDYVAKLMEEGKMVMFVGDGTNDAVAVTQADVGVQIASVLSASDVTRGAADVVLLNGLEGIPFLMEISRVSFRRMVFNFGWSAVYNVLAILLASGAAVNVRIPPQYAGLGEIVSVLPVIFAASTMLMKKIKVDA